jgi:transglutaminase-like putative cysteine protease
VLALLAASAAVPVAADPATLSQVIQSIDAGQFRAAESAITEALAQAGLSEASREQLLFQRERMRRILMDFSLDPAAARERVRTFLPDLTEDEFVRWDERGMIEHRLIDGRLLYFNRAPSNLFRLSSEARARQQEPMSLVDGPMETPNAYHRRLRDAAIAGETANALPQRVRVTQTLTVDADAVPAGENVSAWIPYPRALPGQQQDIRLLASEPSARDVAPESAGMRTVHLEKPAAAGRPTEFSITYELTVLGQYHSVDGGQAVVADDPDLASFLGEDPPHIVFTNSLRIFSEQVVGDETNPWRIAQKLFSAVDEIPWAGAIEYSTITNISERALEAGHADCGQQTLLLIALMRMNGIPARWQSGMVFSDGEYWNLHDWGWFYIAPYGWMPMDVTFGRFEEAPELDWFYLGGLDGYRIAFNDEFGSDFDPPKKHFRSDTVDSQRGEVEWDGGNLYFDQWDYSFHAEIIGPEASNATSETD